MIEWGWINQCSQWMYGFKLRLEEVLVEYDGPHLALFSEENGNLYFGIFCDFNDNLYRWMLAQISGAERIAIISGAIPLVDVFKKRIVVICDFDEAFSASKVWHCSFDQIPTAILPSVGQPLPSFAQRPIRELVEIDSTEGLIKLDGPNVKKHSLPFRDLGRFLVIFQDYWEKLSKTILNNLSPESPSADYRDLASLSFCVATQGSVNIHFKPTIETSDALKGASNIITKMNSIQESGVPTKMVSELGKSGLRDAGKMYSMLHASGIDMLLVSENMTWYVGSEKAGKIARIISKTTKAKENNQIMRGHFCAGRSKKSTHTFEFVDELTGISYKGKINPIVWKYTAISIGEAQYYEVEIEVFERLKGDQTVEMAYVLMRSDKLARDILLSES